MPNVLNYLDLHCQVHTIVYIFDLKNKIFSWTFSILMYTHTEIYVYVHNELIECIHMILYVYNTYLSLVCILKHIFDYFYTCI